MATLSEDLLLHVLQLVIGQGQVLGGYGAHQPMPGGHGVVQVEIDPVPALFCGLLVQPPQDSVSEFVGGQEVVGHVVF